MISKNTPRQLDKSSDYRLIPSTAMVDALNLSITESIDTGESGSGDIGVLKNILGTEAAFSISVNEGETNTVEFKPVGACVDERLGIAAVFVWSSIAAYNTVLFFSKENTMYSYTTQAYLSQAEIRSPKISFSENSRVKGNFITSPSSSYKRAGLDYDSMPVTWRQNWDKDVVVYFTDGESEPKKINLSYYLSGLKASDPASLGTPGSIYITGDAAATAEDYSENDVVLAAPRTPLKPIRFAFSNDETSRVSTFKSIPGFQFAYQYVYRDGTESAISPYSDIAFPPSVLQQGNQPAPNHDEYNQCVLDVVGKFTKEWPSTQVETIRIIARQGNTGRFFIIAEVDPYVASENWQPLVYGDTNSRGIYYFKNDSIVRSVSKEEEAKQFNNLPRKARTQTIQQNRLFYGNYTDGYDNLPKVEVESSVEYNDRLEEGRSGGISVEPGVYHGPSGTKKWGAPSDVAPVLGSGSHRDPDLAPGHTYGDTATQFQYAGAINKSIGFRINTDGLSNYYAQNSEITINIGLLPNNNFHVYEARCSYHGTRHLTHRTGHSGTVNASTGNPVGDLSDDAFFMQSKVEAGDNFLKSRHNSDWAPESSGKRWTYKTNAAGPSYFGKNAGVGQTLFKADESLAIDYTNSGDNFFFWHDHTSHRLPGQFSGTQPGVAYGENSVNAGDPRKAFYGTSAANPLILKGEKLLFSITIRAISDVAGARAKMANAIYDGLIGGAGNLRESLVDQLSIVNVKRVSEIEYDLGLTHGRSIQPGGSLSDLICGVKVAKKLANPDGQNTTEVLFGEGVSIGEPTAADGAGRTKTAQSYSPPDGYFILNKAKVEFYIEPTDAGSSFARESNDFEDYPMLKIAMGNVRSVDAWTCVKPLTDPNGPWVALDPEVIRLNAYTPIQDWLPGSLGDTFKTWFGGGATGEKTINDYARRISADTDVASNPFWYKYYKGLNSAGKADFAGPSCQIGYLAPYAGTPTRFYAEDSVDMKPFCRTRTRTDADAKSTFQSDQWHQSLSSVSLVDGQSGPGSKAKGQLLPFNQRNNSETGSIPFRCDIFASDQLRDVWSSIEAFDPPGSGTAGFDLDNEGVIQYNGSYSDAGNTSISNNYYPRESPRYGRSFSYALATYNGFDSPDGCFNGVWPRLTNSARESLGIDVTNRNAIAYFSGAFWTGDIRMNPAPGAFGDVNAEANKYDATTALPYLEFNFRNQGEDGQNYPSWGSGFVIQGRYPFPKLNENKEIEEGASSFDFRGNPAALDDQGSSFNNVSVLSGLSDYMSFKSSSSHSFGIVYYDERGRHGFVNPIPDVYVAGYGDTERQPKGSAEIKLEIKHDPPTWAKNWKIVYGGNNSVSDFIQYFAGGAFVRSSDIQDNQSQNIYVSLNYLQNHPVSYVSSFGARPAEGGLDMYSFAPGDRLRILSFATGGADEARQYPDSYEFEIVDYVLLGEDQNPFVSQGTDSVPDERHKGAFLVLKDNYKANGFTYSDVRSGIHNWGDNAMIEIYSPAKVKEDTEKIYYEIGDTYDVLYDGVGDEYIHSPKVVTLKKGDVFFRKVPINARDISEPENEGEFSSSSGFKDIIVNTLDNQNVNGSKPRFREYYCETKAANDTFPSDSLNRGRPNFYLPSASESFRDASITYSDASNPGGRKMNYGSFNPSLANFKDLREEYGPIQSIQNMGDDIFVIQSDRCTSVPVNRNIIQSSDGNTQLTTSTDVLGAAYVYSIEAGCDFNPESIAVVDDVIYFAHKSMGKVFKYTQGSGIEEISDRKMASFFRDAFRKAIDNSTEYNSEDVRVVGGYDPQNDEYIISIIDPGQDYEYPADVIVGCTDPNASNYSVDATADDGSCLYDEVVPGCTDPSATNYSSSATFDDGSCEFDEGDGIDYEAEYSKYRLTFEGGTINPNTSITLSFDAEFQPYAANGSNTEIDWSSAVLEIDGVPVPTENFTYTTAGALDLVFDLQKDDPLLIGDPAANITVRCSVPYTASNSDSGIRLFTNLLRLTGSNPNVQASPDRSSIEFVTLSGFQGNVLPFADYTRLQVAMPCDAGAQDGQNGLFPRRDLGTFTSNVIGGEVTINASLDVEVIDNLSEATGGARKSLVDDQVMSFSIPITINVNTSLQTISGCTNPDACNYDPYATFETVGACIPFYYYCGAQGACNFRDAYIIEGETATVAPIDGFEIYTPAPEIDVEFGDGCGESVFALCDFTSCVGCTDPQAQNYNADATIDSGRCQYVSGCVIPADVLCAMSSSLPSGQDLDGVISYAEMYEYVSEYLSLQTVPFNNVASYLSAFAISQWGFSESCAETLRDIVNKIVEDCGPYDIYEARSVDPTGGVDLGSGLTGAAPPSAARDLDPFLGFEEGYVAVPIAPDGDAELGPVDTVNQAEEDVCLITGPQVATYALMWWVAQQRDSENTVSIGTEDSIDQITISSYTDFVSVNFWVDGVTSVPFFCLGDAIPGCTDPEACNYNEEANFDSGECVYPPTPYRDCEGNCLNDEDQDDICDEEEILGCTNPEACNYNPDATEDDGLCQYLDVCGVCDGSNTNEDLCVGCKEPGACNYNADYVFNDQPSCEYTSCRGCMEDGACNYDETATIEGECDFTTCAGCTDPTALNYDPTASIDDGSCIAVVEGCMDSDACNYNLYANTPDGSCDYETCRGCCDEYACNFAPNVLATDGGVNCDNTQCDYEGCTGCTNPDACNYDSTALIDDGSCDLESCYYCSQPTACNYDPILAADPNAIGTAPCIFAQSCPPFQLGGGVEGPFGLGIIPTEVRFCPVSLAEFYGIESPSFDGDTVVVNTGRTLVEGTVPILIGFNSKGFDLFYNPDQEGTGCEAGCLNESSCNYDENALVQGVGTGGANNSEQCHDIDCEGNCVDPSDALSIDECGICGGPGAIYECGCSDIPDGACDCEGHELGSDDCQGCTDPSAANYAGESIVRDCSGNELSKSVIPDLSCCTYFSPCVGANVTNEVAAECVPGCTDANACNYNQLATDGNAQGGTVTSAGPGGYCTYPVQCENNSDVSICPPDNNTNGFPEVCPDEPVNFCKCPSINGINYNQYALPIEANIIKNCLYAVQWNFDEPLGQKIVLQTGTGEFYARENVQEDVDAVDNLGNPIPQYGTGPTYVTDDVNQAKKFNSEGDARTDLREALGIGAAGQPVGCDGECVQADVIVENFTSYSSCEGDLNGDNTVATADLLLFLADFNSTCPSGSCTAVQDELYGFNGDCPTDFDMDGAVTTSDLLFLLSVFGTDCLTKQKSLPVAQCNNACNIYRTIVDNIGLVVTERQVKRAMGCPETPCN